MSLFQFGLKRVNSTVSQVEQPPQPVPSHVPELHETSLSAEEHASVVLAVSDLSDPAVQSNKRQRRGKYSVFTDKDRAKIGKYASEHGNERARKWFSKEFPNLHESTIRNFKRRYLTTLKEESKKVNPEVISSLPCKSRGRPPLLLELDGKLIQVLRAVRSKGGVLNIHVMRATAKALIKCNPSMIQQFQGFEMRRSWVQSIYRRMGLSRRLGTTGRHPVPRGIYEECRFDYLHDISNKVSTFSIVPDLIINIDQTPSSYVSVGRLTMARQGSQSVPIKGLTDKRNITLTFSVTLSGLFLPIQVIYGGKTTASQPRGFTFPKEFCISQNPKHWSNEAETFKLIDLILNPYIINTRSKLGLPESQKALLIMDTFKGQLTDCQLKWFKFQQI